MPLDDLEPSREHPHVPGPSLWPVGFALGDLGIDALEQGYPLPIVDEMYTVLRHVRGIDRELLRRYTDFLHARAAQLSPPERFVLQRLEGLERLAAWHPAG